MDESREQQEQKACSEYVKVGDSAGLYKAMLVLLVVFLFSFIVVPWGLVVGLAVIVIAFITMFLGIMALVKPKSSGVSVVDDGYEIASVVTPLILLSSVAMTIIVLINYIQYPFILLHRDYIDRISLSGSIAKYIDEHYGQLPPADTWCDDLLENKMIAHFMFDKDSKGNWYCRYSMNRHAAQLSGKSPDDMVLFFQSKKGWNQVGGLELLPEDKKFFIQIFQVDGTFKYVKRSDVPYLRWKPTDTGIIPRPSVTGIFTAGVLVLSGLLIWIVKRCQRHVKQYKALILMASISVVVGLAFGTMAESLYTKSYSRNLGPIIGAVVGLFIGVIYNVILATVREHKPNCPTMIGYGTMLGAIAGVLCSTLVHAALMFAYTETNFSNLMFGLAFGSIAGIILGWIATALIGGQQKTAQAIDG